MTERKFKYMQEDFKPMPVKLEHLDIYINFFEDRVEVENTLTITAKETLKTINLDASDLEIKSVELLDSTNKKENLDYDYDKKNNKLNITLPKELEIGETIKIITNTTCYPNETKLEGIYKDTTPKGAPQQYMSQCQQWGFQRIMPIFDDCQAKCTMTTTLEGDARYTHLISNGNICTDLNPDKKPILKKDNNSRQIIKYKNEIPMSPYLFLSIAGTWDMLEDTVTYPNGKKIKLEYLVPKGYTKDAIIPMQILKKSILWIKETQDYEYKNDTYRTICMNKSDFGGMENVGNTTIVTDAALIDEHTLDSSLVYAHAVIVHEFEHNQCGSETTMQSPFDIWLNEAFTVNVERQFLEEVFNKTYMRLNQVSSIRNPILGPLAIEEGGVLGRIQRIGFNHPDELIDGLTYVKAAEVIRMLKLLLGKENFIKAKNLYFTRYKNSNANTEQFFECFEEIYGKSLEQFKKCWVQQAGYPKVVVSTEYNPEKKEYKIKFKQEKLDNNELFVIPISLALVDLSGKDIEDANQTFILEKEEDTLTIKNIDKDIAFVSLNRNYSFYGTLDYKELDQQILKKQAMIDPNLFNRVEAMNKLTDIQRIKLLKDINSIIDKDWTNLYGEILKSDLPFAVKANMLSISITPLDRDYISWYTEQITAQEKLKEEICQTHYAEILKLYNSIDTYNDNTAQEGIEKRMLKNLLLSLISKKDTETEHKLILEHYKNAKFPSDKISALAILNTTTCPKRKEILETHYNAVKHHLSGYANYLRVICSRPFEEVFEEIEKEIQKPTFDKTQPTHARALILPMVMNNKVIWTDKGLDWITEKIIEYSNINTTLASRLLNIFQLVKKMKPELKKKVIVRLTRIKEEVDFDKNPTIHNQTKSYLD
jgi:aminopeptidase N